MKTLLTVRKATPEKVSITVDNWTADNTKAVSLGVAAHWIDIIIWAEPGKEVWELHSEVILCQALSGNHSGKNLSHYVIGLCDHMGISGGEKSKVCPN